MAVNISGRADVRMTESPMTGRIGTPWASSRLACRRQPLASERPRGYVPTARSTINQAQAVSGVSGFDTADLKEAKALLDELNS
jgi:hypothetical protein